MRVSTRRLLHDDHETFHHDVLLIAETEADSLALDLIGKTVDGDGLIATGVYEIRLSDGVGTHYVLLKGRDEHAVPAV